MNLQSARVVLVRPTGPINIGLCCRLCANLGVGELAVVNPGCKLSDVGVRQYAVHAKEVREAIKVFSTLGEAVADCDLVIATSAPRRMGGDRERWRLPEAAAKIESWRAGGAGRLALLFGNEAQGLNNDELALAHAYISLDAPGTQKSYNLSHAVAITLYGLATTATQVVVAEDSLAKQEQLEALAVEVMAALDSIDYFRRAERERFAPIIRRLVHRGRFQAADIHTLRGILAQLAYFLGKG